MERLTKRDKNISGAIPTEFNIFNIKDIKTQERVQDCLDMLAEYEDFMEEQGFDSLEELDNYIQSIHSHYDEVKNKGTCGLCEKLDNDLIEQFKKQLAEKDKEVEWYDKAIKYQIEKGFDVLKKFNQDKIEFAIEKMVELGEHFRNTSKDTNGHMKSADLVKYINQQIEELKEE